MTISTKYQDKPQVILESRSWSCGICNNYAKFNSIEGHDNAWHLSHYLEVIAWFKANFDCCAKTGA